MTMTNEHPNLFFLGFHKDTGELVEIVPPAKREVLLHPSDVKKLSLELLDKEKRDDILYQLEEFNRLIKNLALPTGTITFLDIEGASYCGGVVNGIPFRYKC